jgi:hypothetical protein
MRSLINSLRPGIVIPCLIAAGTLGVAFGGPASELDEKAIWEVWKTHQSPSNSHAVVIAACGKITPANELSGVSQGIAAWHLLQLGKTNEASAILEAMAAAGGGTPFSAATKEMAFRWLSRLDLEKVKPALQLAYRRNIEYPATLNVLKTLPPASIPPLNDRWGMPWKYEPTGFKKIPGLIGQSYQLSCVKLGDDSALAKALARPYADNITLKPISITATSQGNQILKVETSGGKTATSLLAEGAQSGAITFAYGGLKVILLTNGDHWLMLPKPK